MTSTAVATVNDEPKGIRGLLEHERAKRQILPFLRGANYEAVVQETILAVAKNPDLRKCEPTSIIGAVATAVRWGGVIGEDIHLVPFGDKVTPMKDYKFKARKVVETGAARQVYAVAVYKNEPFVITQGTAPSIQHQVLLDEKARGAMVGAYAVAILRNGQAQIVSKTVGEIDKIRKEKSKSWKSGELPEWYALKTVIHQLAKLLPQNAKLKHEIEEEERIENGEMETVDVTVADVPRLANGVEALPPRGNAAVHNDGYDMLPQPTQDDAGRPVPKETVVERPSLPEPPENADQDTDVVMQYALTAAGQWEVPAGDLRGYKLGHLDNARLVALRDSFTDNAKFASRYAGTIEAIQELLEERREFSE